MPDDIAQSIQAIAKTKEIKLKLEKVTKELEILEKEAIKALRSEATQTGSSTDKSGGATGSDGTETGTENDGGEGAFPDAPPQTPKPDNPTNSNQTDSYSNNNNNQGNSYTPTQGTGNSNLSSSANGSSTADGQQGGSLGGSAGKNVAEKGDNDVDAQKIYDAFIDLGYSAEDALKATNAYVHSKDGKNGYHDVGDVATGEAGPPPSSTTNWHFIAPRSDIHAGEPNLKGVTGFDPATGTAMVVNIISKNTLNNGEIPVKTSYIPSIVDAQNANQGVWTDSDTPPVDPSYEDGKVWAFPPFGFSSSFYDGIVPGNLIPASSQFVVVDSVPGVVTSLNPQPGDYLFLTSDPDPQVNDATGTIGGTGYQFQVYAPATTISTGYGQQDCGLSGGDAAACAADPPVASAWPQVGLYILFKGAGYFFGSVYDLDLPSQFKGGNPQSSVQIQSYAGETYNIIAGVNGGTLIENADGITGGLFFDSQGQLAAFVSPGQRNFYISRPPALINPDDFI